MTQPLFIRLQEQIADLTPFLALIEAEGSGVQVVLSVDPGGKMATPKLTIFPRLTRTPETQ